MYIKKDETPILLTGASQKLVYDPLEITDRAMSLILNILIIE